MDDWDWSYSDWSTPSYDWGSSYDWSTPSWDVPTYSDWSAPSYDWSTPSYDDFDSVNIGDWSTPSYDAGYWSDYLPSYESSYDYGWSTPSYNEYDFNPVSYEPSTDYSSWSDIQPVDYTEPSYSYSDYSDMDSAIRNIDLAEGLGDLSPYQAEEARLGVQQDTARQLALENLQQQASEELSGLTTDAYRQQREAEMQQMASDELAALAPQMARQERMAEYQKQASSELDAIKGQLAQSAVKDAMGMLSSAINPQQSSGSNPLAQASQQLLTDLAKKLGATGLAQAQAAAKYQASPIAGALGMGQSVLQILKAFQGQDRTPTQARSSTVQGIGPSAQAARPVRTLYAKGGAVELPTEVMGGLLPLTLKIAEHMLSAGSGRHQGLIPGEDGGQDDVVDIKAAPGEYVIDAEIVSALGDGNSENGARKLDEMRYNIRKHKRTGGLAQIAPKAKNVKEYLKG